MAEEEIATGPEAGAGRDAQTQAAEPGSQEPGQAQSTGSSQVGTAATDASSKNRPGRNVDWVLQRKVEKAVKSVLQTALQEHLTPIHDALSSLKPRDGQTDQDETPDYNNLGEWIVKRVNSLLEQRLNSELPKTANRLKSELSGEFQTKTRMQEARNYLVSQKDIGRDQAKLDDIKQIMLDYQIDVSADPTRAAEIAVELWRGKHNNPNAPLKSHLSTISGGAGTQTKREPTVAELKAMQDKIASGLTIDEREKLSREIDALALTP